MVIFPTFFLYYVLISSVFVLFLFFFFLLCVDHFLEKDPDSTAQLNVDLNCLCSFADPDTVCGAFLTPGSGMGKKSGSGSGINIPDPQHCILEYYRLPGFILKLIQHLWTVGTEYRMILKNQCL
jgi:hypothetical protein